MIRTSAEADASDTHLLDSNNTPSVKIVGWAQSLSVLSWMLSVCLSIASYASPAAARSVALTFDDLPVFGRLNSAAQGEGVTQSLLAAFKRHNWR